jgi:hypothetical protein
MWRCTTAHGHTWDAVRRFKTKRFQFVRGATIAGDLAIHAGLRFYAADHAGRSEKAIYTYKVKTEYKSALNIHIHSYQQIPNA